MGSAQFDGRPSALDWRGWSVMLVVLVAAGGILWATAGESEPSDATEATSFGDEPTMAGLPYSNYTHEDEPFARDLFNEQVSLAQDDDEELLVLPGDMDGTYTHIESYERRSLTVEGDGPTVWFFGGSTLFGIGQRDEHTIPSEIARLSMEEGTPIHVTTFGFPSYLAWQEVGLLRRALKERPPPDLIVFYHGLNDMAAICRQLALGEEPDSLGNPLFTPDPTVLEVECIADPESTGALVARAISREVANARAAAPGIPIVGYWQPTAATRSRSRDDTTLIERTAPPDYLSAMHTAYLAALKYLKPSHVDLTDAMNSYQGPIYFDHGHTNELGARLVAEAMWNRSLRQEVEDLRHGS